MSNYIKTILINIPWILYYVIKARIWMRHPERHSLEDRYKIATNMVERMNRSSGYKTICYGEDKLPS